MRENSFCVFTEIATATGKRNQINIRMCLQAFNENL